MPKIRVAWGGLLMIGLSGVLGCHSRNTHPKDPAMPFRGIKLVVGAVGDPAVLATVTPQRGEWEATRGGKIEIRETLIDPKSPQGVAVLLFRGDRLGDLIDAVHWRSCPRRS